MIKIRNKWTGQIIKSVEADTLKKAIEALSCANADLRGADLRDAVLTPVRDDVWAALSAAPAEVEGLRAALIEGRVDGSCYEGQCACLVGTIANVRGVPYTQLGLLFPNASRPAERFFLGISKGDTPETSQFSALALKWVDEWLANMRAAFAAAAPQEARSKEPDNPHVRETRR